jgi:hypothetical protein
MFRTIAGRIQRDTDYPARQYTNDIYTRVLEGAFYDHLPHGFHQEKSASNEYVPLRDRRPSVRYGLCRLVVDDSVSLLFSEGHFPVAEAEGNEPVKEALAALIKDVRLNDTMLAAATMGSVGSVAIHFCALRQKDGTYRPFFKPHRTQYLTPTFDPAAPDTLAKLREQYKVRGEVLRDRGYTIDSNDLIADFWFAREWDENAETWFIPWKVKDENAVPDVPDRQRTVTHNLGFVPWVWVRNLPGELKLIDASLEGKSLLYSDVDGGCTFAAAIDDMIEIDYQLSQAGRGLKYSMDPLLMLKEPAAQEDFVRSPANALMVGEKGDAKLLEMGGSAFGVVIEYVRALRELGLESAHGNRANADKVSAAQSGRAMELMNQSLIWLADKLRVSYGEGALLTLLRMALKANEKYPFKVAGKKWGALDAQATVSLRWSPWYQPTASDRNDTAQTLKTHKEAGHMSRETAVKTLAGDFDIEDIDAELKRIEADQKAELDALKAIATSKISATV